MDLPTHLQALRRYALALTRNRDSAEDLVQETLLRAIEGARTWRVAGDLRKWLLSILRNAHVSRWRRHKLEAEATGALQRELPDCTLADQTDRIHLGETMAALMALPAEQREALVLVAMDGVSYRDAAEILEIPVGTLMSRLARARATLRDATGRQEGGRQPRGNVDKDAPSAVFPVPLRLVR